MAATVCADPAFRFPSGVQLPGYIRRQDSQRVLVFVHGIWGDGRATWLHPSGSYWPSLVSKDSLFDDFDIFVYQYPTPRTGSSVSIPDLVTDMKTTLSSARVFEAHRQVVFVAHSMGGLITRGLVLRHRELAAQVPMIFFFATPTTGSVQANFVIGPIRTIQVEGLRPIEWNSFLQVQQGDWLAAQFPTRSLCAFETEDTVAVRLVSRESATALCSAPPHAISGDHSEVVKPA